MRPKIQIVLDLTNIEDAIEIASQICKFGAIQSISMEYWSEFRGFANRTDESFKIIIDKYSEISEKPAEVRMNAKSLYITSFSRIETPITLIEVLNEWNQVNFI